MSLAVSLVIGVVWSTTVTAGTWWLCSHPNWGRKPPAHKGVPFYDWEQDGQ